MLVVGFDAQLEQAMYLDRFIQGHDLLKAIARVNRRYPGRTYGLVVDYLGAGDRLTEALATYSKADIKRAFVNIEDELPRLDGWHDRVLSLFRDRRVEELTESMGIILPRPGALPYIHEIKAARLY
nr:hypothetical protein [Desulfobacterales bacterium]